MKVNNLTELEKEDLINKGYIDNYEGKVIYSEQYVNQLKEVIVYLLQSLEEEHIGLKEMTKDYFKEEKYKLYELIKDL